LRWWYLEMS